MSIEAMKLALEALKSIDEAMPFPVAKHAMSQLRQAIEQAQKRPAPMSEPNRIVAYSAAEKLRSLGYQWDEKAAAWQAQKQEPVTYPENFIDALRYNTALREFEYEQAQKQDPVAWITQGGKGWLRWHKSYDDNKDSIPLYTSPPQRQPLTDDEIFEISNGFALFMFPVETRVTDRELAFARAIEEAVNKQPRIIPLTDDEMWKLWNAQGDDFMEQQAAIAFARAIEAAHGITGEQK